MPALNYGSLGEAVNGAYIQDAQPGSAGPSSRGFGPASFACKFALSSFGYIDCTTNTGLNITGPMTAIAWIKAVPGVKRFQTFLGRSDNSWRAAVDWSGIIRWADGRDNPDAVGQSHVDDGTWHFFAGIFDGAWSSLYVDGKLEGTVKAPVPPAGSVDKTIIGTVGDYLRVRPFEGSVAQVAIFTNALSADDILRIYRSAEVTPAAGK